MWRKTVVCLSLVGVLYGCDVRRDENARLQAKVDSLTTELETNRKAAATLQDLANLMDSIDANRNALKTRMVEGTSFEDYTLRMREINGYVKKAQNRIAFLENRVKSWKGTSSNYAASIKRLKHELEIKDQELTALQDQVTKYRNENENLVQTVSLQEAELSDKLHQLKLKVSQIDTLERSINILMADSKIDQAESYYKRAQAVEEIANRTKFAPRKKRDTRKEALELYKIAAAYGKEEAQEKVTELQKKI